MNTTEQRRDFQQRNVYHGFQIFRIKGRFYGLPLCFVTDKAPLDPALVAQHPAALSAMSLDQLQEQIHEFDIAPFLPAPIGTSRCGDYDLYELAQKTYAVPKNVQPGFDLNLASDRNFAGVLQGSMAEIQEQIDTLREATAIEFGGWLPVFAYWGNCGKHPQFRHINTPPEGYRFTRSSRIPQVNNETLLIEPEAQDDFFFRLAKWAKTLFHPFAALLAKGPKVGMMRRLNLLRSVIRLYRKCRRDGAPMISAMRFVRSRNWNSQLLLDDPEKLVFLTSMPFTFGQNPWVIEIEDPTTLFYPMIQNGLTAYLELDKIPWRGLVQTLLEDDSCKGIITHMESTAKLLPVLFPSEAVRNKIHYIPLGVELPDRVQTHEEKPQDEPIDILFTNSWHQLPNNFFVRGGLDVLEAFAVLRERYPQVRLTLRTQLPPLDPHFQRILEGGQIRVISRFLTEKELADLHVQSDIFLLPSARIHIVSMLQAMAHGLAVVGSDGWGMREYIDDEETGLLIKGREGKVSWADYETGLLREDYGPMFSADPEIVANIVESVSRLVESRALRRRLGRAARAACEERFTLASWNDGLKRVFDLAHGKGEGPKLRSVFVEEEQEVVAA
jgi:glycosyltransferase involved in cell wall biosynthesis